jgi:hypothetical protein
MGPGSVIVPCQETARYHRFTISLCELVEPEGTQHVFGIGTSIVDNLNSAIRQLRPQDEWIWIIGDDHVFEPRTLIRLLERDADVIAPICTGRAPPFGLMHFAETLSNTEYRRRIQIEELPDDGEPFEVEVTGSLTLIKREVLEAVGDPWFRTSAETYNEEFDFCDRVREVGFKVMVDPSVAVGHIGQVISYPQRRDGVWGLVLDFPGVGRNQIFMPGGVRENSLGNLEPALA